MNKFINYEEYLQSDYWDSIKNQVLERDDYRCRLCNSNKKLKVHHRTYNNLGQEKLEDLLTLCGKCHFDYHHKVVLTVDYSTPQSVIKRYADMMEEKIKLGI